jgi:hypothetical protein
VRDTLFPLALLALLVLNAAPVSAAPPNTMPIWRVQVRFITADVSDAGTDDPVWVRLNDGNTTYLDSGRDDRERGKDETYDLRLDGVSTLADIDYFRIEKSGSGGWAIRRMMLIVNNVTIYDETFSPSPLWLDNDGGQSRIRFVDDMFMRPRYEWNYYPVPVRPSLVPNGDMSSRVESLWGDHMTPAQNLGLEETGHRAAFLNAISLDTWQVHVDLTEDDTWLIGQDINVDFKMRVGCVDGRPDFTTSDVNASSTFEPYTEPGRATARNFANGSFKPLLNEMMKGFRHVPFCPRIVLAPNGDLHFNSRFPVGDYTVVTFATASLLDLHVSTGEGVKPYEQSDFVATLRSQLKGDAKAELSFELPAQVAAYDVVVEARTVGKDAKESRTFKADLKQREDGTSALTFSDLLPAQQSMEYTLHVVYQPKEDGEAHITTTIRALDDETQKLITPLVSTTYFVFKGEQIFPEGTSTTGSHHVDQKPIWREPKPEDGK